MKQQSNAWTIEWKSNITRQYLLEVNGQMILTNENANELNRMHEWMDGQMDGQMDGTMLSIYSIRNY